MKLNNIDNIMCEMKRKCFFIYNLATKMHIIFNKMIPTRQDKMMCF